MSKIRIYKCFTLKVNVLPRIRPKTELHKADFETMQLAQFFTKLSQISCKRFQLKKQVDWCWFDVLERPESMGRTLSFNGDRAELFGTIEGDLV
jgi:hypothetical protein